MVGGGRVREARIVAVGDELLCGRTLETNSQALQRLLGALGVRVTCVTVVPDRAPAIASALDDVPVGGLVITTGGLGPTEDDLTLRTIADWAESPLVEAPEVVAYLRRRAESRGWPWGPNLAGQALHPEGTRAIINPVGTAPAVVGDLRGRLVVVLPGVPGEMRALWPLVETELAEAGLLGPPLPVLRRRTVGLSEPQLNAVVTDLQTGFPGLDWSIWLSRWGADLQVSASGEGDLPPDLAAAVDERLAGQVFASDARDLHERVLEGLLTRGLRVASAESCTGGLIGAALSECPGSSAAYLGGVVAYANEVKTRELDVPVEVLHEHGAVSRETAEAMVRGVRGKLDADLAVAVTGIAGPDGGTVEKPLGTTWIAWAGADGVHARRHRFGAGRERNRQLTVSIALMGLLDLLEGRGVGHSTR